MSAKDNYPIVTLPEGYREVYYLSIKQPKTMILLNVLSVVLFAVSAVIVFVPLIAYHEVLDAPLVINSLPDEISLLLGLLLVMLVLPLHEWIHGQFIKLCGHKPRYGIKFLVLFATADGAYFRRNEFVRIAMAPLIVISLLGLTIMLFLPGGLAVWVALAVLLNAGGAIGDIWMTIAALRFDPSALVQDEADSIRIFTGKLQTM